MPSGDNFKGQKPTNTPGHRCTDGEVLERVSQIAKMMIQGYARYEIIPIFQDRYGLSVSQIDDYIAKGKKRIYDKNSETLQDEIELVNAQITDMYQGARKQKKRADCGRAIKLRMELKGLEAPKKININTISEEDKEKVDALLDANI